MDFLTETKGKINAQKAKKIKPIATLAIVGVAAMLLPSCTSTGSWDQFATRRSSSVVHTYRTSTGGLVTERQSAEFKLTDVTKAIRDTGRAAKDFSSARNAWIKATRKYKN